MTKNRKLVYGLNETGKSIYVDVFLKDKNAIIWSPNPDDPYKLSNRHIVVRPTNEFDVSQQLQFINEVLKNPRFHKGDWWVVFDEAHNCWPNKLMELPQPLQLLITKGRHAPYNLNTLFIALRPAILNATLQNLALSLIVFRVTGKNDKTALNNQVEGMGDAATKLQNYHYLEWRSDWPTYKEMPPVKI